MLTVFPFTKIKQNTPRVVACQTGIRHPAGGIHEMAVEPQRRVFGVRRLVGALAKAAPRHRTPKSGAEGLFDGPVVQFALSFWLSPNWRRSRMRPSEVKENGYILFRSFLALIALFAFVVSLAATRTTQAAAVPQDSKQDIKFTAEQIVESVILVYGSRPALDHIRRNGVERGKITRFNPQGNPEESSYERRFVRGENLDKDKIRLDQKLPTMEYSLIFGDGKLWGVINGAAFTPRQDATASFISQHHHSIDSLLRYKECGSTLTLIGKDQQKGLDLYVVDLTDKEQRKTRYYISAKTLRVLWLEYEEGLPGGVPVKYMRKFLDYRIVQQTLAPYRIVLFEDGRQSQETRVLTITYGIKVNDSIFKNSEG